MASILSQNRFGAHGDVMSASPDDDAGKTTLCEEIKNRARAEFGRKNLPQAEMLYSKGLEIKPEDATLHSNLAAVRLGLNKPGPALKSSEEAVRLDSAYAKGHFRKGQALMALSRPAEAADAFRVGAALEPESKLWAPLVNKAVKAADDAAVAAPRVTLNSGAATGTASRSAVTSVATTGRAPAAATDTAKAKEGVAENGGGEVAGMKGYKKTTDGRVTTYFNNELTDEAKALIGDIAPKKLESTTTGAGEGRENGAADSNVSVWNKAGTWESRDMTTWAKDRLYELLTRVEYDAPEGTVVVVKVDKLEGDAEISHSRGRKRYMFDFHFDLKWEATDLEDGPAKGVLIYPDVGQDCDGVYDVECRVDSSTPPAAKAFVDRHVRAEGSGLKKAVLARLATFTAEFNAK